MTAAMPLARCGTVEGALASGFRNRGATQPVVTCSSGSHDSYDLVGRILAGAIGLIRQLPDAVVSVPARKF